MPEEIEKQQFGEQTGVQVPSKAHGMMGSFGGDGTTVARPDPATFGTYREMRKVPTIALARAVAQAPIRTAEVGYEGAAEDTPKERIDFIGMEMRRIWPKLVGDMTFGIDYGFSPFENVFAVKNGLIGFDRVKSLVVDKTTIVIDRETGQFAGFRQGRVELSRAKSFLYTHDKEADNYYGRSRFENIRETAYTTWKELSKRHQQFAKKIASIIPVLHYPEGESEDENGSVESNFELAKKAIFKMMQGDGIVIPNEFARWAEDLGRTTNPEKLRAWIFDFLEVKGNHLGPLVDSMRYQDSLMFRGILVPERTAIEGQLGTKAEAGAHGAIAIIIADLTLREMLAAVNEQLIDCLLLLNWGAEAMGSVRARTIGLDPLTQAFFGRLVEKLLSLPDLALQINNFTDFDAILREVGLPAPRKSEDGSELSTVREPMPSQGIARLVKHVWSGLPDGPQA